MKFAKKSLFALVLAAFYPMSLAFGQATVFKPLALTGSVLEFTGDNLGNLCYFDLADKSIKLYGDQYLIPRTLVRESELATNLFLYNPTRLIGAKIEFKCDTASNSTWFLAFDQILNSIAYGPVAAVMLKQNNTISKVLSPGQKLTYKSDGQVVTDSYPITAIYLPGSLRAGHQSVMSYFGDGHALGWLMTLDASSGGMDLQFTNQNSSVSSTVGCQTSTGAYWTAVGQTIDSLDITRFVGTNKRIFETAVAVFDNAVACTPNGAVIGYSKAGQVFFKFVADGSDTATLIYSGSTLAGQPVGKITSMKVLADGTVVVLMDTTTGKRGLFTVNQSGAKLLKWNTDEPAGLMTDLATSANSLFVRQQNGLAGNIIYQVLQPRFATPEPVNIIVENGEKSTTVHCADCSGGKLIIGSYTFLGQPAFGGLSFDLSSLEPGTYPAVLVVENISLQLTITVPRPPVTLLPAKVNFLADLRYRQKTVFAPNEIGVAVGENLTGLRSNAFLPALGLKTPWPTRLNSGVEVLLDGKPIPLQFGATKESGVSQVNFLIPMSTPVGVHTLQFRRLSANAISLEATAPDILIEIRAISPAVISGPFRNQDLVAFVSLIDPNTGLQTVTVTTEGNPNPVQTGGIAEVYVTGLGVTDPIVEDGDVPPEEIPVTTPIKAWMKDVDTGEERYQEISGITAFSSPLYPGTYKIRLPIDPNATIPASGNAYLVVLIGDEFLPDIPFRIVSGTIAE